MNEEINQPRPKRLQRKELALFLLPLCIFGFYMVALRARNTISPPPKPSSFLMSPTATSPDGLCTAQIIRWEHEPEGSGLMAEPGNPDYGSTGWILRVTRSDGLSYRLRLACYYWGDEISEAELAAMRKVHCRVAWDKSGRFLTYQLPGKVSGTAVYLDTCLRPWKSTHGMNFQMFIGTKAKPLTADLRKRLTRRGCKAKEIARLKYVQLQGEYFGTAMKDFINWQPDVLLVIGPHFGTHGQIISLGPVLAIGEANNGNLASQQWIFFDDNSSAYPEVGGSEIFISATNTQRLPSVANPTIMP